MITDPVYTVCFPSSDHNLAAVTVVQKGEPLTFEAYGVGNADDLFDVTFYGDPQGTAEEQRWFSESVAAYKALIALANLGLACREA